MQSLDVQILHKLRLKYPTNPLIGYLYINSTNDRQQLDYFELSEAKLGCSFPFAQFHIWDYGLRNRRDRDKSGGGLTEFVNKEIITERLKDLELNLSETIYTELTISKKMWFA